MTASSPWFIYSCRIAISSGCTWMSKPNFMQTHPIPKVMETFSSRSHIGTRGKLISLQFTNKPFSDIKHEVDWAYLLLTLNKIYTNFKGIPSYTGGNIVKILQSALKYQTGR